MCGVNTTNVFRYLSTMQKILWLVPILQGFHVDGRFGDPADPGAMAAIAPHIGSVFGERVEWIEGIESIKSHLTVREDGKPKLFIDRSCTNLIREMTMLRVQGTNVERKDPKEGQHKYNDHAPDALRYFMGSFFVLGMGSSLGEIMKWEYANRAVHLRLICLLSSLHLTQTEGYLHSMATTNNTITAKDGKQSPDPSMFLERRR